MRPHVLATGEFYHIYNRGIDKRLTFIEDADYRKFLFGMLSINSGHSVLTGSPLVGIVAYAIMPNHYHFLMRQEVDGGITRLFHRLMTSYAMFFNKKYGRDGHLCSASFKSKHVTNEAHLEHLIRYIHQNPLGLTKQSTDRDPITFLRQYPWSSFSAYLGKFDPLINAAMPELFELHDYRTYPEA